MSESGYGSGAPSSDGGGGGGGASGSDAPGGVGGRGGDRPPSPRRYRGITWEKVSRKWRDQLKINLPGGGTKKVSAGYHDTQEDAARAHAQ